METEAIPELPHDGLANVLRVLPPRSLAVARCVCKAWRDVIDARALLLRHLLPHSVRGAFVNYIDHRRPHLFARPSTSSTFPNIDGLLSFLPNDHGHDRWRVLDHCNGLVLCSISIEWEEVFCVCNPATRRWTLLPQHLAEEHSYKIISAYIAFDPVVSPHYEVFLIPDVPNKPMPAAPVYRKAEPALDAPFCLNLLFSSPEDALSIEDQTDEEDQQRVEPPSTIDKDKGQDDDPCRLMEWPPSPWSLKVFSSRTGAWEERSFVREGQPAGIVEDMRLDPSEPTWRGPRQRYAVYHNGGVYVHCRGSFMARFSLSNCKYQIIEIPTGKYDVKPYLGISMDMVHFGVVEDQQLRIWMLSESTGHMEWFLKCEVDIGPYADHVASLPYNNHDRQPEGSWMVQECCREYMSDAESNVDTQSEENVEWDSDNDDIFTVENAEEYGCKGSLDILGFHPYKEVVFLVGWFGVASYHLNSAKVQFLGNSRPRCYYHNFTNGIYESFIYTPCTIGDLLHGGDT